MVVTLLDRQIGEAWPRNETTYYSTQVKLAYPGAYLSVSRRYSTLAPFWCLSWLTR
jgi:hypothetical protein